MGGIIAARLNFFNSNLYFNHTSLVSNSLGEALAGCFANSCLRNFNFVNCPGFGRGDQLVKEIPSRSRSKARNIFVLSFVEQFSFNVLSKYIYF